jgi:hypothetical protein
LTRAANTLLHNGGLQHAVKHVRKLSETPTTRHPSHPRQTSARPVQRRARPALDSNYDPSDFRT